MSEDIPKETPNLFSLVKNELNKNLAGVNSLQMDVSNTDTISLLRINDIVIPFSCKPFKIIEANEIFEITLRDYVKIHYLNILKKNIDKYITEYFLMHNESEEETYDWTNTEKISAAFDICILNMNINNEVLHSVGCSVETSKKIVDIMNQFKLYQQNTINGSLEKIKVNSPVIVGEHQCFLQKQDEIDEKLINFQICNKNYTITAEDSECDSYIVIDKIECNVHNKEENNEELFDRNKQFTFLQNKNIDSKISYCANNGEVINSLNSDENENCEYVKRSNDNTIDCETNNDKKITKLPNTPVDVDHLSFDSIESSFATANEDSLKNTSQSSHTSQNIPLSALLPDDDTTNYEPLRKKLKCIVGKND